jgi:Ca2+-binding EF-hand superfamily protein
MKVTLMRILVAAPLLLTVAAPVAAQTGGRQAVPRADFLRTMDGEFRKMDADKDNVLSRLEIEQFQRATSITKAQARNRALFVRLDTDRDGQISSVEFLKYQAAPPPANAAPLLNQTDLNKDQSVTLIEYRTAKLSNFDQMDTDKDGVVSPTEMTAAGL